MISMSMERFGSAPAEDLLSYPGRLPDRSFVYLDGELWALGHDDDLATADRFLLRRGSVGCARRIPILCLGSNACPPQIARKLRTTEGDRTALFLLARVEGIQAVYAGHIASYGAIPASGDKGGEEQLFVALYTAEQLAATFASEHGNYDLCALESVRVELPGGVPIPRAWAFLSRWGTLTLAGGEAVRLDAMPQEELLTRLLDLCEPELSVSAADYAAAPSRYRAPIEACIRRRNLRRPSSLRAQSIDLAEVFPLDSP
jgi:hypothetical protein